jgi:GT2 family glycosyltransferase
MPNETIVSEDGAFVSNQQVIAQWQSKWPRESKLIHLTQRDDGNRKPLAMNKAVASTQNEYMIFIDGDCVLRQDFISDHISYSDENAFLTGRRVELSARAAGYLTKDRIDSGYLDSIPWFLIADSVFGHTRFTGRFFKVPGWLRKPLKRDSVSEIRGCNFSVYRKHLVAVNGFSNEFSGAYGEDTEIEYRLKFHGLKMKSIKGAAIQYHLWHLQQVIDRKNEERLKELERKPMARTLNGLAEASRIP